MQQIKFFSGDSGETNKQHYDFLTVLNNPQMPS